MSNPKRAGDRRSLIRYLQVVLLWNPLVCALITVYSGARPFFPRFLVSLCISSSRPCVTVRAGGRRNPQRTEHLRVRHRYACPLLPVDRRRRMHADRCVCERPSRPLIATAGPAPRR